MGSGVSAGIDRAIKGTSDDDLKTLVLSLEPAVREKLANAVAQESLVAKAVLVDASAASGQNHRRLEMLPKAHLHLHLPAALRRSSFTAAVQRHLAPGTAMLASILDELAQKEREDIEKGNSMRVEQHQRRRAWIEGGCAYPALLDPSNLMCFDRAMPQKDLVWDIQYVTKWLLEKIPEDGASQKLIQQTVVELAEDAAAEGIIHAELMTGFTPFVPGSQDTGQIAVKKWTALFEARKTALAVEPGLSMMFVMVLPNACKTEAHAREIVQLLKNVPGYDSAAMAGIGYFAGEGKIKEYEEAFKVFRQAQYRLVCIHAGEGEPSRGQGPAYVRHAMEIGAERIGHGIEAAADAKLMEELKYRRVCLEVCPLSNRALECCPYAGSSIPAFGSVEGLAAHPLIRLLEAGVECALSADDPLYWAGERDGAHGLVREFRTCREIMRLDDAALARLADASLVHSSALPEVVAKGRAKIKEWIECCE